VTPWKGANLPSEGTKKPVRHVYHRWMLAHRRVGWPVGRYCWGDGNAEEIPIRTFRTRAAARKAARNLTSYRGQVEPRKITVILEEGT
jgi:hypothetical protein